jgi:putative membrane protein
MNHRISSLSTLSAAFVALGIAACGGNEPPANAPANAPTSEPAPSAAPTSPAPGPSTMNPASGPSTATAGSDARTGSTDPEHPAGVPTGQGGPPDGVSNAMGGTPAAAPLNDAEIADVVSSINKAEIEQAQLALTKASSPAVRHFAEHMISAHRTMQSHDTTVLAHAQITPTESTMSRQLKTDTHTQLETLQGLHKHDFDRQYVDDQVDGHRQALEFLDKAIPTVKNADLKADLEAARPKVNDHFEMAERLQKATANAAADAPAASMGGAPGAGKATTPVGNGSSPTTPTP